MGFVELAKTADVAAGQMKAFVVEGKKILLVNYHGNYFAIGGRCTHMGGELAEGKLEGNIVTCPLHGSRFDVTTGKNISGPRTGLSKMKTGDEPAYEIRVEGNSIKVNI